MKEKWCNTQFSWHGSPAPLPSEQGKLRAAKFKTNSVFFLVENRHQCDLVQGQGLRFLKISAIYFNVEGLGLRDNKETSQLYGLFAIFEKP